MYDVAVIGGGLAGLAAADRLARAGLDVVLVEARDRLGGRVRPLAVTGVNHPIEMGAEWFDHSGPVHQLLTEAGAEVREADGHFWQRCGREYLALAQHEPDDQELRRRLSALDGTDRTLAAAVKECTPNGDLAHAWRALRGYVEGFHAADPAQLSLHWFLAVEQSQPAEAAECRAPNGLQVLIDRLAKPLAERVTLHLGAPVRSVRWSRRGVELEANPSLGAIRARRAVITVPVAVLTQRRQPLKFTPAIRGKVDASRLLCTGAAIKTVLIFDQPFWKESGPRDALFVQEHSQPLPTWWTWAPDYLPVLTGWLGGSAAVRTPSSTAPELYHQSLASCAAVFDVQLDVLQRRLRSWHWHDWSNDPWSRGAYTWVAAGGIDAHARLAEPVRDTLFFAGEATCGAGMNATMDGAIESGRRAAEEIVRAG